MNATASVVEMKLKPIAAAVDTPTVQVTAQYLIGQFDEFSASSAVAGHSMRDILAATVRGCLPAEIAEVSLALTGLKEATRVKEGEKTVDGPRTGAARKFASWIQSVYGAIRFAGMSAKELDGYASADAMYAASVEYRKQAGGIDWKGNTEAEKEAAKAKKAKAKAVAESAEDAGMDADDILTMNAEQLAELQKAAKAKLAEKEATAKLESLEKKAKKIAADLVKVYSLDDAEGVLKRALEMLATGECYAK